MEEEKNQKPEIDVKNRVMGEIRKKRICISSPNSILAKKLGLECAMICSLLAGTFLVSFIFYILEKTRVLKFLFLGMPGLEVFLLTIPYWHLIIFFGILILVLYIFHKLDLPYETKISCGKLYFMIFGILSILTVVFVMIGIHDFFIGISQNRIPKEKAVLGKVRDFSGEYLLVEEEGQLIKIKIKEGVPFDKKPENIKGKYLRAVGARDPENFQNFQAESILCCDNN